jgi:phosphate transport system permease protein
MSDPEPIPTPRLTLEAFKPAPRSLTRSRRAKDRAFRIFMWACGVLALLPLAFIAFYVLERGISALNVAFFTREPEPPGVAGGGIVQSFIGSGIIVGIAVLISVPLGVLGAVYLSEYGRRRLASAVRFVAEILLSTPSIVAGAFIWGLVVVAMGTFSGVAAAISLSVLMWPIIVRATEEVLRLVPQDLREGALALGLPRWKMILRVVVPTAGAGIFTAIMLAVARGLGETAPILLTALGNDFINLNPAQPMDAVTLRIYAYARTPVESQHIIAWGASIMLLVAVLLLSVTARILSARQQRRIR